MLNERWWNKTTMAKKKKDSNFNVILCTYLFYLPNILLSSNKKSNYLLKKKSEHNEVGFWVDSITFCEKTEIKEGKKSSIFTTLKNSFWQLLQKLTLWPQKSTFLSSDFFAESQICHFFQVIQKNVLVAVFWKSLSFLFLP